MQRKEALERVSRFVKQYEDIFVLLFFIVLAYFYLGANIFSGEIVAPMDLLLHYPGWQGTGIDLPIFNLERSDILDTFLPIWDFGRDSILSGEIPLWNHLRNGGSPCLTIFKNPYLSAGYVMFFIFGGGLGFTLALLIRVVIAGIGTYKLCRTELGILPSIFGGVTYMMCGFNASWLMWTHVETSMWIPWLLWAIILLARERTKKRFILLSIIVALLIFGGFPFVAFSGLILGSLLIMWLVFLKVKKENKIIAFKTGLLLFLSLCAGILIASPQILPFVEWLMQFDTTWRQFGGSLFSIMDLNILWDPFVYTHDFGGHIVPQVERCGHVGIITILFSFIAVIASFNKKRSLSDLSPLFWIIISLIASIAVFNVTPLSRLIYELPFFNNNPNNRLLVILGLSFAILGAYGMNILLKTINLNVNSKKNRDLFKSLVIIIFILIIAIHTFDMASVGKSQNAVVPSEAFYPTTPTIEYAQNHILPGQSVLATSAYLVSGTLSFYNIPEWFAHGYLKSSEKEILAELVTQPWKSPTSAMFDCNQINFNSTYMDKLGIRYILTKELPQVIAQTYNDFPSPPMPSNTLGQAFNLREIRNVYSIDLLMATYREINAEGYNVTLTLYDNENKRIAKTQVNGKNIQDNNWVSFKFDDPIKLNPGKYFFEVVAEGTNTSLTPITIWGKKKTDSLKEGFMIVNRCPMNADLTFKIIGIPICDNWNIISVENNIAIFENKNCPPGAYIIYDEDIMNYSTCCIKVLEFGLNTREYLVKSNYSGLFVTTCRSWPGWQAYYDGNRTDIKPYLGMLQAVSIEKGTSIIKFQYVPYSFYIGLIISFITLVIIGLMPKKGRLYG